MLFQDFSYEPVEAESVGERGGRSKVCDRDDAFLACLADFAASNASASAFFMGTPPNRPLGASVPLPFGAAYLLVFFESLPASFDVSLSTAEEVSLFFEFTDDDELMMEDSACVIRGRGCD